MARVDFYQLARDPAEALLPVLAEKTLGSGARMSVAADDAGLRARLSEALWRREGFLAHGEAGAGDEDRQPILLGAELSAANGAHFAAIADGRWRDAALGFDRAFYLFDDATLDAARAAWRALKPGGAELHYWRQEGRRWIEGP